MNWGFQLVAGLCYLAVLDAPILLLAALLARRTARDEANRRAATMQMRGVCVGWFGGSMLCMLGGLGGLLPVEVGSEQVYAPILYATTAKGWLAGWMYGRRRVGR